MAKNILLQDDRRQRGADRPIAVSARSVVTTLIAIDVALMLLLAAIAIAGGGTDLAGGCVLIVQLLGFVGAKAFVGLYPGHGVERAQRVRKVVLAVTVGLLASATLLVLTRWFDGIRLSIWPILVGALLVILSDPVARRVLHHFGRWQQPVFIFGGGEAAAGLVRQLAFFPHLGLRPVCIVDESSLYIADDRQGIPVIRFRELGDHASLLAMTTTALVVEHLVERSFIQRLYTTGIFQRVLLVPSCHDLISLNSQIRRVGSMLAIEAGSERPRPAAALAKRAFDLVVSGMALLLLSPLLGLIAFLVRQDSPGPAVYSQPRWAGADRQFTAFKFRTMYTDGERRLRRHFLNNPNAEREYARYRKLDNDPRVTTAGRFLRATSLDELPQLFNVLRGDMSIIGPRPYTMDELSKLGPATEILGLVPPGITGFWQVSGRNQRTFRERIEMDCYYVRNYSGWLDIWIFYRTIISMATGEGK